MKTLAARLALTKILVVDDERFMRNVIHALLVAMGADKIYEAADGTLGLELVTTLAPDLVILDWEMPGVDGPAFMRTVRSPGKFPRPDVPVIMLTGHGERSRVAEAMQLGINEFLVKPVSRNSLEERITAILTRPRPMIRNGNYYGPAPRKLSAVINDSERPIDDYFLVD